MARWAMRNAIWYHFASLAIVCCAGPVGLVIQTFVLIDLARTPRYHRGRTGALVASIIYLVISAASALVALSGLIPLTSKP